MQRVVGTVKNCRLQAVQTGCRLSMPHSTQEQGRMVINPCLNAVEILFIRDCNVNKFCNMAITQRVNWQPSSIIVKLFLCKALLSI